MSFALLAIFAVLAREGKGDVTWVDFSDADRQPCENKSNKSNYLQFVHKHILDKTIDGNDYDEWRRYLLEKGLCNRTFQSFIQAPKREVKQVCGSSGRRLVTGGNLCISKTGMKVYHVKSCVKKGKCIVKNVTSGNHKVVVACRKVGKKCLPVHYERWRNQTAGSLDCSGR